MNNPFSKEEELVMNHLIEAYNAFSKLKQTHPNEKQDFTNGIHILQYILGMRILRRDYPTTFKTYKENK